MACNVVVVLCVVVMLKKIYPMIYNRIQETVCTGGPHIVLSDICIRNTVTMATQEVELAKTFCAGLLALHSKYMYEFQTSLCC